MRFIFTALLLLTFQVAVAANQTAALSSIESETALPFTMTIEEASFTLPAGVHSGASARYDGKWVILAGRTNGLHGFGPTNNFPPSQQNTVVHVVDIKSGVTYSRDLTSATSRLTQAEIDSLSVTSPQSFHHGKTLYICGGYGVDTSTGLFSTKATLTALDLPKLIKWVIKGKGSAAKAIRQTSNSWMQVTGGNMYIVNNHLQGLLIFGQNFSGQYTDSANGNYTRQVRRFQIIDTGKKLHVLRQRSESPNANYRRRDLNVVPIIKGGRPAYLALSGVFTLTTGVWTVPVVIEADGSTKMADPSAAGTFKQGMNNYASASAGIYSKSLDEMYTLLFGGISFGYFSGGVFNTDSEIPFINQVTAVKRDKDGNFTQYLMDSEYPVIFSTGPNTGNRLIFGAGAFYFKEDSAPLFSNGVVNFNRIKGPTTIGYIVGGIMSTLANTNTTSDSLASPYVFKVTLVPR